MDENGDRKNLEKLLEENLRLTKEVHQMSKRVNRYVTIQQVLSIIYLLLIAVPIIIGIIYLPPLISNFLSPYSEILRDVQNITGDLNSSSSVNLLK